MSQKQLEQYEHESGLFVPFEAEPISWDTVMGGNFPEPGSHVIVTATLYDIPRTTIAALRKLERYDNPYATVYNSPRALEETANALPDVNLVANMMIPPSEVKDVGAWQQDTTRLFLAAGCAGALVNFDCVELAQADPDSLFLRYTENVAA